MVSKTYDFDQIDSISQRSDYSAPIFVLNHAVYGGNLKKTMKKVEIELNLQTLNPDNHSDDALFLKGQLI